jgi:hypothetical protein
MSISQDNRSKYIEDIRLKAGLLVSMPLDGMNDWDLASLSSSLRDAREELRLKQLEEASHHFRQNWVMGLLFLQLMVMGVAYEAGSLSNWAFIAIVSISTLAGLIGQSR